MSHIDLAKFKRVIQRNAKKNKANIYRLMFFFRRVNSAISTICAAYPLKYVI